MNKNEIITWNNKQGNIIFGANKKKLRSKEYERIGLHLIPQNNHIDDDNSPNLVKC